MNNSYVRKVDILDLMMYHLKNFKIIILIMFLGVLFSGGYRANQFRIALNNEKYVQSLEVKESKRVACLVYLNGKDYNSSAAERVTDFGALVKSKDVVEKAMATAGVSVPYDKMCNLIYYSSVANNMAEISVDLSVVGDSTVEQASVMLEAILDNVMDIVSKFEDPEYVTIVEQVHEGAYHLAESLASDENQGLDKTSEIIGVIKYCILGAGVGFAASVLLLCICYLLSPLLRTEEDLCHGYGSMVIGRMFGKDKESLRKAKAVITQGEKSVSLNVLSMTDKENREEVSDTLAAILSVNETKAILVKTVKKKEISAKKGLYDYVTGKCSLADIIVKGEKFDVIERLDAPEEMDFFTLAAFEQLMEELKKGYDYVVFDSPAYQKSADGVIISTKCDKTVLVAGRSCVKEDDALELKKNLVANEIKCVGMILTK